MTEELVAQGFKVRYKALVVKYHAKAEGKRGYKDENRENHPEPRPVFFLTGIRTDGNCSEEFGAEHRQELAYSVGELGTPYVRGVFEVDIEEIGVAHWNEAKLTLEHLIEHNEEHYQQQSHGCADNALVGKLVVL